MDSYLSNVPPPHHPRDSEFSARKNHPSLDDAIKIPYNKDIKLHIKIKCERLCPAKKKTVDGVSEFIVTFHDDAASVGS